MLDLRYIKNVTIIGGGTAGWFAALSFRKFFPQHIQVELVESPTVGIVGVGEGGLINLVTTLNQLNIPVGTFMKETGASFKWGFCYEGWRTGKRDDEFYHLFINPRHPPFNVEYMAFYPLISAVLANSIPLADVVKDVEKIKNRVSLDEALKALADQSGIATSLHFDSQRTADFLGKIAIERGVKHTRAFVQDIEFNEHGFVTTVQTDQKKIETQLLIDASGFARLVIGKKFKSKWTSFKEYLWLDKAIPFHLDHDGKNPELVSRATAMEAGWMWQIPLIERIGAGYVYSSEFKTEEQALAEIEKYFGKTIKPQKTLSFEPGHFEKVWQKNVMALGLASGFVEPLEATSIGQMLEQLRMMQKVILESGSVISDLSIEQFNQANAESWKGICDFLRMHYDCPRRDTPFWKKVAETPFPESYKAIKEVFMQRTPRMADVNGYVLHGWNGIFHVNNWIFVAQALGLISPEKCRAELQGLKLEQITYVNDYLRSLNLK